MLTKHEYIIQSIDNPVARYVLENDRRPWYIPVQTKRYLINEANERCKLCGMNSDNLQIDHIHPVSKGGKCLLENLQVLCSTCNLQKSNHILDPSSYERGYPIVNRTASDWRINQILLERIHGEMY